MMFQRRQNCRFRPNTHLLWISLWINTLVMLRIMPLASSLAGPARPHEIDKNPTHPPDNATVSKNFHTKINVNSLRLVVVSKKHKKTPHLASTRNALCKANKKRWLRPKSLHLNGLPQESQRIYALVTHENTFFVWNIFHQNPQDTAGFISPSPPILCSKNFHTDLGGEVP